MSLRERIFPITKRPELVQTQWAPGWGAATSGFGYAASFLTRHRTEFGATIDQAGIAIIFLQRHRVELALKELLHEMTGHAPAGHSLEELWGKCEKDVGPLDTQAWTQFSDQRELIEVLNTVDGSSTVFRYPVDRNGTKVNRPEFIDLDALDEAVERFEYAVGGYIDYWTETQRAGP